MGIVTDAFFVEGLFESLTELGVAAASSHARANGARWSGPRRYVDMGQRRRPVAAFKRRHQDRRSDANIADAFVWKDVPGGVVFEADALTCGLLTRQTPGT